MVFFFINMIKEYRKEEIKLESVIELGWRFVEKVVGDKLVL